MRERIKSTFWITLFVMCLTWPLQSAAQFPEDALRFATPGLGAGARSLGMGNAYIGVAADFSAIYWNPAGLAQLETSEFSFGLSHLNFGDEGTFLNNGTSYSNSSTHLNALGLAYPVEVRRGNLVLAFGYARQSSFTAGLSYNGFNTGSSIIQLWAPDGQLYPSEITIAEELGLAEADTATGRFVSPINGMLLQDATVLEGGGLDNWSAAGAIDIARNLSAGLTLTYLSGRYEYDLEYEETDAQQAYGTFPYDLSRLTVDEFIRSNIDGFNAKLGLLYRVPERFRLGLTLKTPTRFHVEEEFGTTAQSYFDNGDVLPLQGAYTSASSGEYDVVTPWVFGAGTSIIVRDLVISGDAEFTDWTQLEFDKANPDVIALNNDIKEVFRPTLNWRVGLEYDLSRLGLRLRGGFIYNTSPFERDQTSEFDQKYMTGGLGILLSGSTMLDVAYARGWWKTDRLSNDLSSRVNEDIITDNFLLTLSYRF